MPEQERHTRSDAASTTVQRNAYSTWFVNQPSTKQGETTQPVQSTAIMPDRQYGEPVLGAGNGQAPPLSGDLACSYQSNPGPDGRLVQIHMTRAIAVSSPMVAAPPGPTPWGPRKGRLCRVRTQRNRQFPQGALETGCSYFGQQS